MSLPKRPRDIHKEETPTEAFLLEKLTQQDHIKYPVVTRDRFASETFYQNRDEYRKGGDFTMAIYALKRSDYVVRTRTA